MVSIGRFRRVAPEWLAAVLGVAALAAAAAVYLHGSGRVTYRLAISAGSRVGLRHQIAQHLAAAAARRGIRLRLVPTSGSEDALDRLETGALDLALVQGGLIARGRTHARQVASLKVEPLHLLVKAEIEPEADEGRGLEFLRGRTVNLSEAGSGTYDLAREVLAFAGLRPSGEGVADGYSAATLGYRELLAETDRAKLPDAVFTVSALPSPVAKHLVARRNYRIIPLRFGEAFALDATPRDDGPPEPRSVPGVNRVHVYNTEIPAYTYSVSPPVPPRPVPTFGTRLLLLARDDASAEAVALLMEAGYASGPGGSALDPALLDTPPEFDWHEGTHTYRERAKPVILGDAVDFMEKGASLLGALLGGLFFLWQWYRQRARRRGELGFESYMAKVSSVESRALQLEIGAMLDLRELLGLQVELSRLKAEALRRLADGELAGEQLISGFVTHVNDARDYLTRLILHERQNLEEKAALQQRSAESVWCEAVGEPHKPSRPVTGDPRDEAGDPLGP